MPSLRLAFGLRFADLHHRDGLLRLDAHFLDFLHARDAALARALVDARAALADDAPDAPRDSYAQAPLLLALSPYLEDFLAELFGVRDAVDALIDAQSSLAPLFEIKRKFVQRKAVRFATPEEAESIDGDALRARLLERFGDAAAPRGDDEASVAAFEDAFVRHVGAWLKDAAAREDDIECARRYAAWAALSDAGHLLHRHGVLFRVPQGVDADALVPAAVPRDDAPPGRRVFSIRPELATEREGFGLTDPGCGLRYALEQTRYCLICHEQKVDSCSKGLKHRQKEPGAGTAAFRRSAQGVPLTGCPLEERISEFHELKRDGHPVAALAMILVDNPMVAATGHRICNDCVKACVFQNQTPVDIPQAETRTLRDVLALPWGFEIHSLLTRWNPLDLARPLPRAPTGRRVLVVGMGPAGFTLAHHLLNDGHAVVGIDGLRIEPLDPALNGTGPDGARVPFEPVHDAAALREPLDERVAAGFGGVAEYGITNRWDKNFLTLNRLLLERRDGFLLMGGLRFGSGESGGNLTLDDAWATGFDHVALALGAGAPTLLDVPDGLARGVRAASDFLMTLQLGGAARADSITNLQLRLPVVVVGGGLTAIDTATESLAYYATQVTKFVDRFDALAARQGEAAVRAAWSAEEADVADEFLAHGRAIIAERAAAAREARPPRVRELLRAWGGATIAYRRALQDSPAYALSHDEIEHALAEGVDFAEGLAPEAIDVDAHGAVRAIRMTRARPAPRGDAPAKAPEGDAPGGTASLPADDAARRHPDTKEAATPGVDTAGVDTETVTLPARSVFIAAGTRPNTALADEDPARFALDGRHFRMIDEDGRPVEAERAMPKPETVRALIHRGADGRFASVLGDLHPGFVGNVVRAMGSARRVAPIITGLLAKRPPASDLDDAAFFARLRAELGARVLTVRRLAPAIVEVIVHAPSAARHFRPGQFYRLQNLAAEAPAASPVPTADGRELRTLLQMEGLALTGAWVDRERGLVSMIVLEMGGSADLCALLRPGEPVVLTGPTGVPTEIPSTETVLLVGGGLGNAVLFSIGAALRAAGCRVLYVAGYRKTADRYRVEDIEAAADQVLWCADEAPGFVPGRPMDRAFTGNVVRALQAWAEGTLPGGLPDGAIRLQEVDRILAIGSDRMMAAVSAARHGVLAPFLKPGHVAVASINSPMQCMLKRICAQCLQRQVDPATGVERYVFSCAQQDQPMDAVDWAHLDQRLRQNAVQEKLTARWVALVRPAGQR